LWLRVDMILQLLGHSNEWIQHFMNAIIVVMGRSLDILSTRYVSKELKLETNRLARRVGWKGMILIQIPIIILGTLDFYLAFFIFFWSLFLFANNIEGSWYIKEVGEDSYHAELKLKLKKSKTWKIILGESSHFVTYTVSGVSICIFLFLFNDLLAVLFIALALICQGIIGTFRSITYLLNLKKEKSMKEKDL